MLYNSREHGNYQDVPLVLTDRVSKEFGHLKKQYLDCTIANLQKRFPEVDTTLLGKLHVLSPTSWPRDSAELAVFGVCEVEALATHFAAYLEDQPEDVSGQWLQFVLLVSDHHRPALASFTSLAHLVHSQLSIPFPSIDTLYQMALVLSVSSADCERGFSTQNLIKTHKRSCLKSSTLHQLQLIKLEGPALVSFDFRAALCKWRALRNRRV